MTDPRPRIRDLSQIARAAVGDDPIRSEFASLLCDRCGFMATVQAPPGAIVEAAVGLFDGWTRDGQDDLCPACSRGL